jgi:[methyl-Co(III) methanol-specific corrinoid protein]:coenzyme M methyltransferase
MITEAISGRELFLSALKGGRGSRSTVFSADQTGTYELMEKVSAYWPEANTNAREMAALAAAAYTEIGFDAVRVPFCQTIEAEIFGSVLRQGGKENVPSVLHHRYKFGEKPDFPEDFLKKGRIPQVLEAVRILKDTIGDKAAVVGGIIGPFSIAGNIIDVTDLLKAAAKEPASVTPYLEVAEKAGTMFARALIDAGADVICIEDMLASLDLISPRIYRDVAWPWEQKQIHQLRDVPTILHICGKVDPVVVDLANTGVDALSLDIKVDIRAVKATLVRLGKKIPLIGGIDCIRTLLPKGPEDVEEEVLDALDDGYDIIAPCCSIPPATPTANLLAMVSAAKQTV